MTTVTSPSATVHIRWVTTPDEIEQFLDVPKRVYANDPNWVEPLRSSVAKNFSDENPFLEYGTLQPFIAIRDADGKTEAVGRIVAAVNQRLIEREGEQIGLFGFFECIDDFNIAQALFDAACGWLRDRGMTTVRGPINLSTHNGCLMLVDGFESSPYLLMPYNPPYYPQFMAKAGWHKAKDAYAYHFPGDPLPPEFEKGYRIALKSGVAFRKLRTKGDEFKRDCEGLYRLFTTAFANNYSSTPRTRDEFMEEAKELQSLVDPDIFWIAEYNGDMIGFFMALPDYNIALKHVNGRLNWWGILKFLWYRRQVNRARVIVTCSLPEFIRKLVPLALIYLGMEGGTASKRTPYQQGELGYVYEDNYPSRKVTEAAGGKIYKTYRIYEKSL
ncbi:MAG: hypothetical protein ACFE0I_01240 [Elainellaceae cyanobacterium]